MVRPKLEKSKGILNPHMGEKNFSLARFLPSDDLKFFVMHYWAIRWDLRGQPPYTSKTLPHPCVHLVFEPGGAKVYGVMNDRFTHTLEGKGQVLGIKFRPGAFYPFLNAPVSRITDKVICLPDMFAVDTRALEAAILSSEDDGKMAEMAQAFLRERLPEPDANIALINQIIDCIITDRSITLVDDVVSRLHISKRTMQRLFSQYVGVSPKWVIKRYRLHDAAEQVASGSIEDWARLAAELGYFDQAHFIKDFKKLVGQTPGEYARMLGVVN